MGLRLAQQTTTMTIIMSTMVVTMITARANQISELPLPIIFEGRELSANDELTPPIGEENVSFEEDGD